MKITQYAAGLITLFVILGTTTMGFGAAEKIKWHGYEEGVALGDQEGKKLFVHFYTDWCGYCDKMEKETFSDASIASYLNRYFISVRVNSEKQQNVAAQFAVRGVPVTWFVSEVNERISSLPGYIDRDMLIRILKFIKTDAYKTMTFKEFSQTL
jgi:thioredoxin-related protein